MIDAIIDEARPLTLLRRYQDLAATSKEIVRTDIPSDLMPAFVDLALRVKDASVRSVVFRSSEQFSPGDPDFVWLHSAVEEALAPPEPREARGKASQPPNTTVPTETPPSSAAETAPAPGEAVDATDACSYDPDAAG